MKQSIKTILITFCTLFLSLIFCNNASAQNLKVGQIKSFADGTRGIIFYVDKSGHGLVVSMIQAELPWIRNSKGKVSVNPTTDEDKLIVGISEKKASGMEGTKKIVKELGPYMAVAAQWCLDLGEGWYLPSASELNYLIVTANEEGKKTGPISLALMEAGYKPIKGWYWCCEDYSARQAWNIASGGGIASESKTSKAMVRAVRKF